jgi:hypothetical protein
LNNEKLIDDVPDSTEKQLRKDNQELAQGFAV